ncbi:uncharacterized protein TRAVEDRAFT_21313 [Trametes versicolor FP-101664 SS1]|uniref:uncharacterized protein n=1 Tax=Trametes versicolor (strain FP-101664) TaxID=717944 RepID=UPI00046222F3|nr:uncharacterized protein TRAVEDRAFT_21313 [Trametes versicolor FP-101664 SS1]EIW57818.1 hypothetical protein TRAVEDRAFT_21313 [Trametes versicolor FP-101664 SS1]
MHKLKEAYKVQRKTTRFFVNLTVHAEPAKVESWLQIKLDGDAPTLTMPRKKTKEYTKSIYLLNRAEFPSIEKALDELMNPTNHGTQQMKAAAQMHGRVALFIKTEIKLDLEQKHLCYIHDQRVTKGEILDDSLEVSITVESFHNKLGKWCVAQTKLMPNWEELIAPGMESANNNDKENKKRELLSVLGLPSDIEECDCTKYELNKVADHELTIRMLAFDQLDRVRLAVQDRAAHLEHKKKNVHGKKANTQAKI